LGSLSSLDVSTNKALKIINCSLNKIDTLIISGAISLTYLDCSNNELASLDVSGATALTYLNCSNLNCEENTRWPIGPSSYNVLTSLDVSKNKALINLFCYFNQLTSLDVTGDTALTKLFCWLNQLTSLDVSTNTALDSLSCNSNQLTSLNCKNGNNLNHGFFYAKNNPKLTCIQVDNASWSKVYWINVDPTTSFRENCSGTGINSIAQSKSPLVYPNPANNSINIINASNEQTNIEIVNVIGQKVFAIKSNSQLEQIDISGFKPGIYFVNIIEQSSGKINTLKFLKTN
jgi:hypothetical protein